MSIEKLILENLLSNEPYVRRVLPFIKEEYFQERTDKAIFRSIQSFFTDYNTLPTVDALKLGVEARSDIMQNEFDVIHKKIGEFDTATKQDENWLVDQTEKFCKDKAIFNAILESVHIIEGKSKDKSVNALPSILSDALAVSFDNNIGHDYLRDAEKRYEFYHTIEQRIPFDLEYMNQITNSGTPQKTLNVVIAGTGVGKSLFLCHHAANCLMQNKNVLYITCEMAEERIAERIDANIMDITLDDLKQLPKEMYAKKLFNATRGVSGKLIVKEYPTGSSNVNHFRHLLEELKLKKKFVPDIIFVDYLNICASSRFKAAMVNSYTYVKGIAEELRGLAVEYNVPIFTATQTNRDGYTNTDLGLENTSESFGLPQTADFMFALIRTEDLDKMDQVMVKQLKNRYNDLASNRKFILGINRSKMKLYTVEESAQEGLVGIGAEDEVATKSNGFGNKFKRKGFGDKAKNWQFEEANDA
jgi:replicative DNA helicase